MAASAPSSDARPLSAIVVAGPASGVGKTTVTLGLIAALRRRGLAVQPFKVGPDFIDPLHQSQASGRRSRNLDGWMLTPEANRETFAGSTADADVAVIEGVMGLFDGAEARSDRGSTAEMAKLLGLPVLLVIDASAMARSAAALVHGFASFDSDLEVAGVILNRVGSQGHAALIREALTGSIPVLGALPRTPDVTVRERHLGLHLPHEASTDYVGRTADLIEAHADLDQVLRLTRTERRLAVKAAAEPRPRARLAVARDEAFCFYYEDNFALLREAGAELVEFSPLRDPLPADVDGIYIGGGYPELHAAALAANAGTRAAIRAFATASGPIYAECGGLMYLAEELVYEGTRHPQCGVLPFSTRMPGKLSLSYVEVTTTGGLFGAGQVARGHVYHHSEIEGAVDVERCYSMRTSRGDETSEGFGIRRALASYAHLHFRSNPSLATAFVDACCEFGHQRLTLDPHDLRSEPVS